MTTNEKTVPDISHVLAALNEAGGTVDVYALIAELKPFMAGPAHVALALAYDMCPIHNQDLDSCRDDASMLPDPSDVRDTLYDVPLTACAHYWKR